jgi:hypothetical protein
MPPNTSRANVFGLTDVSDGAPTVKRYGGYNRTHQGGNPMHKYAAATALVIALNVTMLTPAVSLTRGIKALIERYNEGRCDSLAHGLRRWAIACHCTFECYRQHSYTVRQPCENALELARTQARWGRTL